MPAASQRGRRADTTAATDDNWREVLQRAFAVDPSARFSSSQELRAALFDTGPVADELAFADLVRARLSQCAAAELSAASTRIETRGAESLAMREVFAVLELAVRSEVTVLVAGETGTGKEMVARAVHERSARRRAPFVTVDCGALPESLLASELFGHVRGAFTGAFSERKSAFR